MIQRIASRLVDHFDRVMCIPDDKVSHESSLQLPVRGPASQRLGSMSRHASPGLFRRQAKLHAGHIHREMNTRERAGAGVIVGGDSHGNALFSELFNRRTLALLKKIERPRQ